MKVLLAIDGSPHSHAALVEFATRPWPHGTDVLILTVIHASIPLFLDPALVIAAAHMRRAPTRWPGAATGCCETRSATGRRKAIFP